MTGLRLGRTIGAAALDGRNASKDVIGELKLAV